MAVTERTRRAGIAAVPAVVIGGVSFAAGAATAGPGAAGRPPAAAAPRAGEGSYADVVRQVLPSVVLIRTASGLGSGVVLDGAGNAGNIVTNAHVAGKATSFRVQFAGDPQPRHARLVGSYGPGDQALAAARPGQSSSGAFIMEAIPAGIS